MLSTAILALNFVIYTIFSHIQPILSFGVGEYFIPYYCFVSIPILIWTIVSFIRVTNNNYIIVKILSLFLSIIASLIYLFASNLTVPFFATYYTVNIEFYYEVIILFILSITASLCIKKPAKEIEKIEKNKQVPLVKEKEQENIKKEQTLSKYEIILSKAKTMLNDGIITQSEYDTIVENSTKNILEK